MHYLFLSDLLLEQKYTQFDWLREGLRIKFSIITFEYNETKLPYREPGK